MEWIAALALGYVIGSVPFGNRVYQQRSPAVAVQPSPVAPVKDHEKPPEKPVDLTHKTTQSAPRAVIHEGSGEEA